MNAASMDDTSLIICFTKHVLMLKQVMDNTPIDIMGHIQGYADARSLFMLWSVGIERATLSCPSSVLTEILFRATRQGSSRIIDHTLLHHRCMVDSLDPIHGLTPLMISAFTGNIAIMTTLLENGAGVDARSACGDTALGIASYRGHRDQVVLLLEHGAIVDSRNEIGQTPMMRAATCGHANVIEMLLRHGADPNVRTITHRETPLMSASQIGNPGIIRMFLAGRALVDERNIFGHTALMMAVYHGNVDCVRLLVDHGADVHARDHEGNTPMTISIMFRRKAVAQFLQDPI